MNLKTVAVAEQTEQCLVTPQLYWQLVVITGLALILSYKKKTLRVGAGEGAVPLPSVGL